MKRRALLLLLLPIIALLAFLYFRWREAQLQPAREVLTETPTRRPSRPPPPPPQAALVTVAPPNMTEVPPIRLPRVQPRLVAPRPQEIPIIDGATIDFSIGAPVVRSTGQDAEALDRALREMAEATKNLTFGPPAQGTTSGPEKK